MQRVAEEQSTKAIELIKNADWLHYQTLNYHKMYDLEKKKFESDLLSMMDELGWDEEKQELKKYLNRIHYGGDEE